jgi:hypothetical protein
MHAVNMGDEEITLEQRMFRNKAILLLVLAACTLEVFLSGRSIVRTASSMHDWVRIFGLLFCVWMFTAIALRAKGIKERFLFGAVSVAFILWTVLAVMLPSQQIVHILKWLIFLMWISATVSGIAILFRGADSQEQ